MDAVLATVKDRSLTYGQKMMALSHLAENSVEPIPLDAAQRRLVELAVLTDMGEGKAPYRPRYILPDYGLYLKEGSVFLDMPPPSDLLGAVEALLSIYPHVPSVTGFPVFVGILDELLEPFAAKVDDRELERCLGLLLRIMDRTIGDSFCHADLGPSGNRTAAAILRLQRARPSAVPNLSLLYDPARTPEAFAAQAALTALETAKPSFANDPLYRADFAPMGGRYGIASCYNGLPLGGGSATLVRLNLAALAATADSKESLMRDRLPEAVAAALDLIDRRSTFILEDSGFFESSFLAAEGLIERERFTAMLGIVGLAECCNKYEPGQRFGTGGAAEALGMEIARALDAQTRAYRTRALRAFGGRPLLHAQVGIDSDRGVTPGCRIPIGEEPELWDHLARSAPFHPFFESGIGDVFAFEPTAAANPLAMVDTIKGAFASGARYLSLYGADSDVVRVTGYLVKRSEIGKLAEGRAVREDTTLLGMNADRNLGVFSRRRRP